MRLFSAQNQKSQGRDTSDRVMANKGQNIWFERALIESAAFEALTTATAHRVLAIFFTKRAFEPIGRKGKESWIMKNNGLIEFTYNEAREKYRIKKDKFKRALYELIDKGFIDIAASGQGIYKVKSLYSISNRWREYGTPDYEQPQSRPKSINRGFQKGNQYGRNCCKEKKTTVAEQHSFSEYFLDKLFINKTVTFQSYLF